MLYCSFVQVWIHNIGLGTLVYPVEKICDDSGEDPTCCRCTVSISFCLSQMKEHSRCTVSISFCPYPLVTYGCFPYLFIYFAFFSVFRSVSGSSVRDHIYYLGVSMHAEDWSSCRIVMDYSKLQYQMDLNGNLVLSKQPGLSNARGFSAQ
jgi:hypothetical protein